jgi:hypothetical protein
LTQRGSEKISNWEEKVEKILEGIKITESDFKRKGASSEIHARILEAVQDEWNKCRNPVFEERAFQIDFVGRTFSRHGKVELAIEVDTWWKPTGNWVKLLDINSANKIWIYVCREKDKASKQFESAVKNFRKLAKLRGEDNANNVTLFMKVADERDVKKFRLFE